MTDNAVQERIIQDIEELNQDVSSLSTYAGMNLQTGEIPAEGTLSDQLSNIRKELNNLEIYLGSSNDGSNQVNLSQQIQSISDAQNDIQSNLRDFETHTYYWGIGISALYIVLLLCVIIRWITNSARKKRLDKSIRDFIRSNIQDMAASNNPQYNMMLEEMKRHDSEMEQKLGDLDAKTRGILLKLRSPKAPSDTPNTSPVVVPPRVDESMTNRVTECLRNNAYPLNNANEVFKGHEYWPVKIVAGGIGGNDDGHNQFITTSGIYTELVAVAKRGLIYLFPNDPYKVDLPGEAFIKTNSLRPARCHISDRRIIIDEKGTY